MITRSEAEYDLRGLTRLVSALEGALFANGEDGDLQRVLKTETGHLAGDISDSLGPKSKEAADEKADRDVRRFLSDRPKYSNLEEGQQYSSTADFTWLEAGPNFLVGINDEDNQLQASSDDALSFFRTGQKTGNRGKAYVDIGQRGKQHLYRLNRTRVSASAKRSVVRSIRDKIGTLRASFALAASLLVPSRRFPQWVSRHLANQANGRGILNQAGLSNPTEPFLEFGSTSPGVESNEEIVESIRGQVQKRKRILESKLEKVLRGYVYDANTGAVFRRQDAGEDGP